jgi:hypothetical protein
VRADCPLRHRWFVIVQMAQHLADLGRRVTRQQAALMDGRRHGIPFLASRNGNRQCAFLYLRGWIGGLVGSQSPQDCQSVCVVANRAIGGAAPRCDARINFCTTVRL